MTMLPPERNSPVGATGKLSIKLAQISRADHQPELSLRSVKTSNADQTYAPNGFASVVWLYSQDVRGLTDVPQIMA